MRRLQIIILIILTLIQNVNSQDKVIKGDTAFWYGWNQGLVNKLELTDFRELQADFSFRFWNHGQVVEIIKNDNQFTGELTNFIYSLSKQTEKRKDTIFNKVKIDTDKAYDLYQIIQSSKILNLKSDNEIDNWSGGCDGITYIIEHSDRKEYWFKNYWTPSVQDSIPESLIVMDFVKDFSDTLRLTEKYKDFENTLPRKGCYNSGGMSITCYVGNSFGVGYLGSTKLPYGYSASLNFAYIGKVYTNFGIGIQQRFDNDNSSDLEVTFGKGNILLHKKKSRDFFTYSFRNRNLTFIDSVNTFQNHQFYYGLSLKNNFDFAAGIDYLVQGHEKIGGIIYASKWFSKPRLDFMIKTSIFSDELDYKIGLSRSFSLNRVPILNSASIGLYYESFKDYNDLCLTLKLWM